MAQKAINKQHKNQIIAGKTGRKKGHKFENDLTKSINEEIVKKEKIFSPKQNSSHIFQGDPATNLVQYICNHICNNRNEEIRVVEALCLGGVATSGNGSTNSSGIQKSKSDILLKITTDTNQKPIPYGVSLKKCSAKKPTNAQIYFTTAKAFSKLLTDNKIAVSKDAQEGLSMFCGDEGYKPSEKLDVASLKARSSNPDRYFWEELDQKVRKEWESIFNDYQCEITLLLLQKAYLGDKYPPEFLLHQTHSNNQEEVAIFSMTEIANKSKNFKGFYVTDYSIRKGKHKDGKTHQAPKFGFIQFQRAGQKQHPTQLQFNLKAGYFNI